MAPSDSAVSLNHSALQALKPKEKTYTRSDRDGLFVEVLPTGKIIWRYKFHFEGKRPKLTIGPYPEIGLADARALRDEAAALLARGINPAAHKQAEKKKRRIEISKASTFAQLAERWFDDDIAHMSESWKYCVNNWLKLDILPALGKMAPSDISRLDVKDMIDKVIERGSPNSANKVRVITWKIFEYAIHNEEIEDRNPVARIKVVKTPEVSSHRALAVSEIKPFFDALEADDARVINKIAIELLMLTLVRKDELRLAKWSEFDLDEKVWRIPGHRTKMGRPHEVYLSRQVLTLLEKLRQISGEGGYVLAGLSSRHKPIGHTTLNNVIDRLDIGGARFVPHGFRATASSLLNEARFNPDAIERQLAHKNPNQVRAVYNQAEYASERRIMLQKWADYVEQLKKGKTIVLRSPKYA